MLSVHKALLVVAINKMDSKGSRCRQSKTQMQERSIPPEDWGGDVVTVPISALKGDNIEDLLEMILLQSELMELKANPDANSEGVIVEARQEVGRGPTATIIVQKGTLKIGDAIQSGAVHCKVKAMIDDQGNKLKAAPPSTPVNILGWSGVPDAGAPYKKFKNEREARREAEEFENLTKFAAPLVEDADPESGKCRSNRSGRSYLLLFPRAKLPLIKLYLKLMSGVHLKH